MNIMSAKKIIKESTLVSKYMDMFLETGKEPTSIYLFAKSLNMDEAEFYKYFRSFKELEKRVFEMFCENSLNLLAKNDDFKNYESREKLLSFYFTIAEMMTANRSFIVKQLEDNKNVLKGLNKLSKLKRSFNQFTSTLDINKIDLKQNKLERIQEKGIQEMLWVQLLLILKFWLDDNSKSFEKTDIFIEKSVNALFDMMNTTPLKSFLDLGKFIFKEKMNCKM
jgi:hypothetical protein